MKTEKAIERIKAFRDYLCAGNPIWDVGECKEAFDIAIAAMEQRWLPAADVPDINDGDMISRQAVIKLILSGRVGDDSRFECPAECNGMLEWAADEVAKMPAADVPDIKVGEWIPVSERLPEIGEHYVSEPCIVYCSNGAYGFAELEENIFGQVGWNCERDDEYHEPLGEVLAWMPLPKPWEGE